MPYMYLIERIQIGVVSGRWLGGLIVRASDLWSTGCEFDSRPCTARMGDRLWAGKASRYVTGDLGARSTQPSITPW